MKKITKFSVGDRVRALGSTSNVPTKKGDTGEVSWASENGTFLMVKWDQPPFYPKDSESEWYATSEEIAMDVPVSWFELAIQRLKLAICG